MSPDWVTLGDVSAPVIRSTSPAPYARGANSFWINRPSGPSVEVAVVEVEPPARLAASDHDGSRPEVFLFIDALLVNRGAIKSNRNERVRGAGDNLVPCRNAFAIFAAGAGKYTDAGQREEDAGQDDE